MGLLRCGGAEEGERRAETAPREQVQIYRLRRYPRAMQGATPESKPEHHAHRLPHFICVTLDAPMRSTAEHDQPTVA